MATKPKKPTLSDQLSALADFVSAMDSRIRLLANRPQEVKHITLPAPPPTNFRVTFSDEIGQSRVYYIMPGMTGEYIMFPTPQYVPTIVGRLWWKRTVYLPSDQPRDHRFRFSVDVAS